MKQILLLSLLSLLVLPSLASASPFNITISTTGLQVAPNFTTIVTLNNSLINMSSDCSNVYFNNATETGNLSFFRASCKEDVNGKSVFYVNWQNTTQNPYIWVHNDSASDLSSTSVFTYFMGFENESVGSVPANAVTLNSNAFVKAVKNDQAVSGTKSAYYNNQFSTGTGYPDAANHEPTNTPLIVTQSFRHNSTALANKCFNLYYAPTTGTGLASAALNPCTDGAVYLGDLIGNGLTNISANTWYKVDYFMNFTSTGNSTVYYLNGTKLNVGATTMFSRQSTISAGGFFQEQNGATGTTTWNLDNAAVANGTSDLPTLTYGTQVAPSAFITIGEPMNQTYYNLTVALNVVSNQTVSTWKYEFNGLNTTFTPNTTINVNAGSNTVKVWADNNQLNVSFYVFQGINLTIYNATNNNVINNWDLNATNSTFSKRIINQNGTVLIEYMNLPNGTVNFWTNVTNTDYVNTTPTTQTITNSSFITFNMSLYRLQYFYLHDQLGNPVMSWRLNITNGVTNYTQSTTTGLINASAADIPVGTDTLTYYAVGFDLNTSSLPINFTSSYNLTLNVTSSILNIFAFDELTGKALPNFTIQLTNSTASVQYIANTTNLTILNFVASGVYTISATDAGYATRNYFYQATGSGNMLNVYLPNVTSPLNPILVSIRASTITNGGIQGILITLSKIVNSTSVIVGSGLTDNSGIVNFNMNPNVQYTLTIAFPSGTQIFQLQPSQSIYTYNEFGGNATNSNNLYSDISYQILPLNNSLSAANNQVIQLNLYSSLGTLQNATITAQWNSTSWVAFGTGNSTFMTATLIFNLSGDTLPDSIPASFFVLSNNSIVNPIAGQYAIIIQRTFYIQKLVAYPNLTLENILKNTAQTSGLDLNAKSLFSLLITILITGFAYSKINLNPAASLILFIGLLGFFAATGWFDPLFFILAAIVGGLYYMISSGAV